MTDQGNDGDAPPAAPGPAAPPPLADAPPPLESAAAPPPVQPVPEAPPVQQAPPAPPVQPTPPASPQPAYQAAPAPAPAPAAPPVPSPAPSYPPPAKSGPGAWPLFTFLAFLVGVGGTVLTLWLTGDLGGSSSSSSSGSGYSSGSYGSDTNSTLPAYVPSTPSRPTMSASPPSVATLTGTWGPGCPSSRNDAITFYADGTAMSDGESGSWSLDGSYVNLNNGRQNMSLYWEMTGNGSARVRRSGDSRVRTIYRCS